MRLLSILPALWLAMPAGAQTPQEIVKAMADIESQSIASFPVGSWVKVKDSQGKELTVTVTQKIQGKDGWQATTTLSDPKQPKPVPVTAVFGSVANLSKEKLVKVADDPVTVSGKSVPCKVFTYASGQKKWMSSAVPAGGTVKVVGPKGEAFYTLLASGKP